MTEKDLYRMFDLTNIQVLMRARRLMLLSRLYQTAPQDLMAMLAELAEYDTPNFVSQIIEDLEVLRQSLFHLLELGHPRQNQYRWYQFISSDPSSFKNVVDRYVACNSGFAWDAPAASVPATVIPELNQCPHCSCFFTARQLPGHLFKAHKIKNPLRRKIAGSKCLCCNKEFHSRNKLIHHVLYLVKRCKAHYQGLPDLAQDIFDSEEKNSAADRTARIRSGRNPLFHELQINESAAE